MSSPYWTPSGGLPPQSQLAADRAVFTTGYAVIPKGVLTDIVTSQLPFWDNTKLWVLARPLTGFAESFSHYLMQIEPNGGSDRPESNKAAQSVIFVTSGRPTLTIGRLPTMALQLQVFTGSANAMLQLMALTNQTHLSLATKMLNQVPCLTRMVAGPPQTLLTQLICATTCM
jgi:glyoxylate utilization-related uncharacterized protein